MPLYQYVAKNADGRTVKGKESASTERELLNNLGRRNITVISLSETRQARSSSLLPFGKKKLKTFDLVILCKQLATLVKGGVPLIRAIESISAESKSVVLRSVLGQMRNYIREGDSLSGSIKRFPGMFSPLFIALVEAGEKVGALDIMLERLSNYLLATDRINKKIITALTYPIFIITFFIVALLIMTLFLIPRFKSMYESFGAKLPGLTLAVFKISDFFVQNIVTIIISGIVAVFLFRWLVLGNAKGRRVFDSLTLKIPIFGELIRKASVTKFTRTLSTLLAEGIPVTESIELVGKTSGNILVEEASLKVSKLILSGDNIPEALRKVNIFPSLLIQMASVGVESGNLPELLDKTADFYEDQVDAFVTVLTSLIEPILIVTLGIGLGITIVALYLPIFKLGSAMSGGGG